MDDNKRKDFAFAMLVIFSVIMSLYSNHFDNCRDAFFDGANVVWTESIPACYVDVVIDGHTKKLTPMQWYIFMEEG